MKNCFKQDSYHLVVATLWFWSFMSVLGGAPKLHAQGSASINVTGIPPVIQQPFTDQIEQNFRNGRYQVIFTYNSSNPNPVNFRFRVSLNKGSRELLSVTSQPKAFRPGAYVFTSIYEELPFDQTFEEVIDQTSNKLQKQVLQEGTIPEGSYRLNIKAIADRRTGIVASAPSITPFTVRFPQPPQLINPTNNANLTLQTPVFNWTPVVGIQGSPIEYDFLLVEVLPQQTPLQALNSNRAIAEKTLINQNTLAYTPEFLPLEQGNQYAWQVTAHLPNLPLPLKNDGQSEFQTFNYQQGAGSGLTTGIQQLQSIPLVPDFASLTSLDNLNVTEHGQTYVLNGNATLQLTNGQNYDFPVSVNNVTIQKGDLSQPVLTGGSVRARNIEMSESFLADASQIIDIKNIRWKFGKAVQAKGDIRLPNGSSLKVDDFIQLTKQGLNGTLVADNPAGVMSIGEDPLQLNITRFEASFPEHQLFAQGNIDLFNGETTCQVTQINVLQSQSEAVISCPNDASVSLIKDSAKLQLMLDDLWGTLDYDFENDNLDYDLNASGSLTLGVDQADQCSVLMQVSLSQNEGFDISQIVPTCSINAPPLDLGFMKFKIDDIDLKNLRYTSGGNWDFNLSLDGFLNMPAMDGWTLPLASVDVTSDGLSFPDLNWDKYELGLEGALAIDGFGITPTSFDMPEFTFPWFDDSDDDNFSLGNWDFDFNFDFNFPNFTVENNEQESSPSIIPSCVVGRTISDVQGDFNSGSFSATLPATVLRGCQIDLAEGYTFNIDELGGELSAEASLSNLNLKSQIQLDAHFLAGSPFNCGEERPTSTGTTHLTMNGDGLLDGQVEDIVTECGADIGPFQASLTQSALVFSSESGNQHITIGAAGELALNKNQSVNGSLEYDVLEDQFNELDFSYDDYFVLNLPSSKKNILSFLVKGISLTKDGLLIDGRQKFILGDTQQLSTLVKNQTGENINLPNDITTISVTFDQALISLSDLKIESGRILFDKRFALKAALSQQSNNIDFNVPADTANISLDPNSAYLKLGTQVSVDKDGLHTQGNAKAGIKISDLEFNDLEIQFDRNFAMGLDPFGVQQGQANLLESNRRVAYINSSGFHLDPTYLTQAVPDTLPMPTKKTAYMVLRDAEDNLLVNATKQSNGTYIMSTNSPVDLVIPAIQGSEANAPKVSVSFTDITYDPGSGEITQGAIQGDFTPAIDLNKLGVPFKVRSISYNDGLAVNDQEINGERGFSLEGDILLYKTQIGDAGSASLFLENGDHLRGDVDLNNLNSDISLVPQSKLAVLHVDSLKGSIDVALDELTPPDVSLDVGGQFRLQNQNQDPVAALNYSATYDDADFIMSAINQPADPASNSAFIGSVGLSVDKINSLTVDYDTQSNDFDFRSELDFSILMDVSESDTLEVPLHDVTITETGFIIPEQEINSSSRPVLNAPAFAMGPAELSIIEFRTLRDITFNWFTGEGVPPAFEMDLDMKLASLSDKAPQASQAGLSLNSVGFNKGVFTGTIEDFTPQGDAYPISLGSQAFFNLTAISGGVTNTGSDDNPVQGYDINMAGNLTYPDFFGEPDPNCDKPELNLQLSKEGGLVGVAHHIAPCGEMAFGPAKLSFHDTESQDANSSDADSLAFTFDDQGQHVIVGGHVYAEIAQENSTNITAEGDIKADVLTGDFIDGHIEVNDIFTYKYPQNSSIFTFRVQKALLNTEGFVISGDAGLTYPGTQDTARVNFHNFTVEPENEAVADGHITIKDSIAFEVGVSPMDWKVVAPSSDFTRENAGRLLTTGEVSLGIDGLSLSGSSTASIHAAGQTLPDLNLDYNNLKLNFSPFGVSSGKANFSRSGEQNRFAYIDKDQFHIDLPGLVTSVLPDTLNLPNRETAYLVLGDDDGSRYKLESGSSPRRLHTLEGETVSLVIPNVKDGSDQPLKVDVAFDARVNQLFNISSGSVSLLSSVDLESYVNIPLKLDSLAYSSSSGLSASASVKLPQSLNGVNLLASVEVGRNGFKQATISAGEYTETYLPSQEDVTPIAADTLGNGAIAFYVRGLNIGFGQTNSIQFSGQLKSDFLKDQEDHKTPIQYAAGYNAGQWDVSIDDGNISDGIDLGYAKLKPTSDAGQPLFEVTMDEENFAIDFSALISMPELLGEDFALTVDQLKINTAPINGKYVTVNASANLPDQKFDLVNGLLQLTSTNTTVTLEDRVLALKTSGSFGFYDQDSLSFNDLKFSSDGTMSIGGLESGNMLSDAIEVLPDSSLVLSNLSLGIENQALNMTAGGFATLPKPLDNQTAEISISADTDGNIDVSGPDFVLDDTYTIGNNQYTEFEIASFATLELTGLGVDINLRDPDQTSLYAAGAVYIQNDAEKRIMFGDAGNMKSDPGIKYSISGGIEWNISSHFDPEESPFSFDYEFFNISISSIGIETNETVEGDQVPFQVEIAGQAGLNIKKVGGEVDFSGFKFSTKGVDDIGQLDGGSFTLMDIVSLTVGGFEYKTEESNGGPFTLEFAKSESAGADTAVVATETVHDVTKYLHFGGDSNEALSISLGEGAFSGGIEEVIYYQKGEGDSVERYLEIKNAHMQMNDQVKVSVGMEYLTSNGEFKLALAGGGKFGTAAFAAAGYIEKSSEGMRFGIFAAASVTISFAGIVTVNQLGGGFYYRPDSDDLENTKDAIRGMNPDFETYGPAPKVDNLKFAALLYGKVAIAGSGDAAAISGFVYIQITDQFTKLDVKGAVLGQEARFKARAYFTILYTPDVTGVEGGVKIDIVYDPVLEGNSKVDFFAKHNKTGNKDTIWGITGNFKLQVIKILDVDGSLIVSPDGFLMELKAGAGFDISVISADASLELTVWYLPDYTDAPLGMYSKARVGFDIAGGLAAFDATIEGGYFKRSTYSMLYFAGTVHVEVIWVIDADVSGYVKIQTKSPTLDYGKGGNAEMEQMISDAKDKANETSEKAEEAQQNVDNAKDDMNDALSSAALERYSDEQLRSVGYNLVSGNSLSTGQNYGDINDVLIAEKALHGANNVPDEISWIANNVMKGQSVQSNGFVTGSSARRKRPNFRQEGPNSVSGDVIHHGSYSDIQTALAETKDTQDYALNDVKEKATAVEDRLQEGIDELSSISEDMRQQLNSDNALDFQNPVSNIQGAQTGGEGNLEAAPTFRVNQSADNENQNQITAFQNKQSETDQRYRQAITAAVKNVKLIDLVASGNYAIDWGEGADISLGLVEGVSINDLAFTYTTAERQVREYNSELIASYWNYADWAEVRHDVIENLPSTISTMASNAYTSDLIPNSEFNLPENQSNINSSGALGSSGGSSSVNVPDNAITEFARNTNDWSLFNSGELMDASSLVQSRVNIIKSEDATSAANYIKNTDFDPSKRYQKFKNTGEDFWYRVPLLGLEELERVATGKADSLNNVFNQTISDIESSHHAFTQSVNKLYTIKAEMLTTVYGMIEEYNGWRQEAFDEEGQANLAPFNGKKQQIEDALTPPTINQVRGSGLSTNPEYGEFYGKAGLSFQATHPQGISEISYSVKDGNQQSIYGGNEFYTAGIDREQRKGERHFSYEFPKQTKDQTSRSLTAIVRVRGNGGTTISRSVNFQIAVDPGGISQTERVFFGDDQSPPTTPVIDHEYKSDATTYWAPDSTMLRFKIKSADPESDIRTYEYKIGTTKGGDDIREWTNAHGARGRASHETYLGDTVYENGSQIQATIRGINLEAGTDYYLSFKTINGDKISSNVKNLDMPIRYEPTPPTAPELTITPENQQRATAQKQPVVHQAVSSNPEWSSRKINKDLSSADGKEYTLSWSAEDPESGINGFSVRKSSSPDLSAEEAFRGYWFFRSADDGTQESFTPSFTQAKYVYIRALNKAFQKSNYKVFGPIKNKDITIPTTPDVRVRGSFDGFWVYFPQLSQDNQTGIKGYQYAIFDSTGSAMLRSWPDSTTVDFTMDDNVLQRTTPPGDFIRAGDLLSSGYYRIAVRAVNNQNMVSRAVVNTHVIFDNTPPTKTTASITYHGQNEIKIDFNDIGDDPESDLRSLRWSYGTKSYGFGSHARESGGGLIDNYSTDSPSYVILEDSFFAAFNTESEKGSNLLNVLSSLLAREPSEILSSLSQSSDNPRDNLSAQLQNPDAVTSQSRGRQSRDIDLLNKTLLSTLINESPSLKLININGVGLQIVNSFHIKIPQVFVVDYAKKVLKANKDYYEGQIKRGNEKK